MCSAQWLYDFVYIRNLIVYHVFNSTQQEENYSLTEKQWKQSNEREKGLK